TCPRWPTGAGERRRGPARRGPRPRGTTSGERYFARSQALLGNALPAKLRFAPAAKRHALELVLLAKQSFASSAFPSGAWERGRREWGEDRRVDAEGTIHVRRSVEGQRA